MTNNAIDKRWCKLLSRDGRLHVSNFSLFFLACADFELEHTLKEIWRVNRCFVFLPIDTRVDGDIVRYFSERISIYTKNILHTG